MFRDARKGNELLNPRERKSHMRNTVERFLKGNLTVKKLQNLYNQLSPKDQLVLLLQLLPYTIAKQTPQSEFDALNDEQVKELHDKLIDSVQSQIKIIPIDGKAKRLEEIEEIGDAQDDQTLE